MADRLARLRADLGELMAALVVAETRWAPWLAAVESGQRESARNLVHYWAIRQHDLRELQSRLAGLGLSSLGRSEPHVAATVQAVDAAVHALSGLPGRAPCAAVVCPEDSARWLARRTLELLGPVPVGRRTRIMVTLPSAAAQDPGLLQRLIKRGMNLVRINCAHDNAKAWRLMARNVRQAVEVTGRPCRIVMDLAGPKLRTGPLEPGPRVVTLRPARDVLGRVTAPARGWLTACECPATPPEPGIVSLPVPLSWLRQRRDGEVLGVRDTRGAHRRLVLTRQGDGFLARTEQTTYLATGSVLQPQEAGQDCALGTLAPTEQHLLLHPGDILELTRDCAPVPLLTNRYRIGCTLPEAIEHATVGQPVYLDDGKISGRIIARTADLLEVRITHTGPQGSRLRAGRSINLPETHLPISAITSKDLADLPTVVTLADIVELSFIRSPADIAELITALDQLGGAGLGIVLKIETRHAFEHLPQLLLTAMRRPKVGVMIARGDLAVECGYERLAELQEEILWLCEAAHLPVIWATQVFEQLAKRGQPSRAEISDAAMSERAECVMLNKGPYIEEAISTLDNVLRRMSEHHYKKNALLRSLRSWRPDTSDSGPDDHHSSAPTTAGPHQAPAP